MMMTTKMRRHQHFGGRKSWIEIAGSRWSPGTKSVSYWLFAMKLSTRRTKSWPLAPLLLHHRRTAVQRSTWRAMARHPGTWHLESYGRNAIPLARDQNTVQTMLYRDHGTPQASRTSSMIDTRVENSEKVAGMRTHVVSMVVRDDRKHAQTKNARGRAGGKASLTYLSRWFCTTWNVTVWREYRNAWLGMKFFWWKGTITDLFWHDSVDERYFLWRHRFFQPANREEFFFLRWKSESVARAAYKTYPHWN